MSFLLLLLNLPATKLMRQSTTTIMVLTLGFDDVATVRIAPAITPTRIAIAIHWAFLDLLDSIVVYSDLGCL